MGHAGDQLHFALKIKVFIIKVQFRRQRFALWNALLFTNGFFWIFFR